MRGASEAGASALPESTHLFSGPHEDQIEECTFSASALSLSVLRRLHQLRVAAVVGQHQDHRRIRVGVAARGPVVGCGAFPPLRPCLQPEDLCDDIAPLAAANSEPETMALASAIPPSRSSRHRRRSVFGEHLTILAISSWRTPSPARWRTFSRTAALTTNGFLAIGRACSIGILAALVE